MDCEKLRSILPDYLDDEAAAELCREIDAHLARCGDCEVEIDSLRRTILIYRRDCESTTMSDGAKHRLFSQLSIEYRRVRSGPTE